ncbi:MAG: hypothetical protein JKY08_09915, partial [Flavobacteriaceae bacterium]|nr:hypothetical protein [Flavobacteriaceae bacterium]
MMIAKLFVCGQEREALWVQMGYYRETRINGKPSTYVMGGLITMAFASQIGDDILLHWLLRPDAKEYIDMLENGELRFSGDGIDNPPTRVYKFSDAFLIYYQETFTPNGEEPLTTVITISPAIQDYGAFFLKRWNETHVEEIEVLPYKPKDINEPYLIKYHFEDDKNRIINKDEINIDDIIFLVIKTRNAIGEKITINLDD